jgi:hypothetical protein
MDAAKLLKESDKNRPRVLSTGVRALADSISKDKKKALKALRAVEVIANPGTAIKK